jgi:chaperonin GroEL
VKQAVAGVRGAMPDQDAGVKSVLRALEEALRQIMSDASEKASVVVARAEGSGNFGSNAATGEYGDLVGSGVLDPTEVTRTALQPAAVSLPLKTDATVHEAPRYAAPAPAPGGPGFHV